MGGLRLLRYPVLEDALVDALRLSRAMSLKNSAAGLDLGGGKAVLLDDGAWEGARAERMRAVGRAVERLGGRYVTAEDVGTTPDDMDAIAAVTANVAGRPLEQGGRGDPSPATARTVFAAIEAGVRLRLGATSLDGIRVGVLGAGHVGARLVGLLAEAGASVSVADLDPGRAMTVAGAHGAVPLPLPGFAARELDVFAPCAVGGAIGPEEAAGMRASVVAGAANNPLADRGLARVLAGREILFVPDFLANCGGIVHVGAEALGLPEARAEELLAAALERTDRILREAAAAGRPPLELAEEFALARMRAAAEPVPEPAPLLAARA